ncbi:conserved hypothetical protein. Putative prophage protein [Tenacibaculum dicentrarchi]|nr:conserved hypothetical protein. Putative prophage protein [Tenacibaculum dicentrarchi]
MGMASSRRYGMQGITLVTTSTKSNWRVYFASSQSAVKWYALGNIYQGETPTIDFSGNTGSEFVVIKSSQGLTVLDCDDSQLTALDITKNTSLTRLYCRSNQLTALDVSKNTGLTRLYCRFNQLTALDVSKNTSLTSLGCYNNQLTVLDVSKNTGLTNLYCKSNPNLATIYVNQNQLDILNGVIAKPQYWDWRKDPTATYVLKQ